MTSVSARAPQINNMIGEMTKPSREARATPQIKR